MPKLAKEFHRPRVDAYTIAIDALEREWESPEISHAQHVEYGYVLTKMKKERSAFIKKFCTGNS